ncbi:MAG TPA: GGDEF domain-containing protein [Haliangium sp.]|nr:GGDEF domain-containing protein [Haliangium sp.]
MPRWDDITGELTSTTARPNTSRRENFERTRPCLVVLSGASMGTMFHLDVTTEVIIGRSHHAHIQLTDEGISRQHVSVHLREDDDGNYWIQDLHSRNGTFCNGRRVQTQRLHDGDKIQLGRGVMLRFGFQDKFDENFQRLMQESALRDGLTHAYNKRYFTERVASELRFARRHNKPLSLILMDLDLFKQVNDRHGHLAGDHVLRSFAMAIQRSIRNEDVFARYGGEEFAVISRSISLEDTRRVAERLRAMIEKLTIENQGQRIAISVSIGIASLPELDTDEPADLVNAADRALYWAKTHGRNQVAVYHPGLDARPYAEHDTEQPEHHDADVTARDIQSYRPEADRTPNGDQ